MRSPVVLALSAAVALSGCLDADAFLRDSRIVLEKDVGPLAAGERINFTFGLNESFGYLVLGGIIGPQVRVHVGFVAPNATAYAASRSLPAPTSCGVLSPPAGDWRLEIEADLENGKLGLSRMAVRVGRVLPPGLLPCWNEPFPGAGVQRTIARFDNVTTNATSEAGPFRVTVPPGMTQLNASYSPQTTENATFRFVDPTGTNQTLPILAPSPGTWSVEPAGINEGVAWTVRNATIYVYVLRS